MREILFRGKTSDDEWIYGYLIVSSKCLIVNSAGMHTVDPETVGQYTGKTDKNGTKIFEGDICKGIDGVADVGWDEERSAFVVYYHDNPCIGLCLKVLWEYMEVVGNIHDNVEYMQSLNGNWYLADDGYLRCVHCNGKAPAILQYSNDGATDYCSCYMRCV